MIMIEASKWLNQSLVDYNLSLWEWTQGVLKVLVVRNLFIEINGTILPKSIDLFENSRPEIKEWFSPSQLIEKVIGLIVHWFLTTSDLDLSNDVIFEEDVQENCTERWFKELVLNPDYVHILSVFDYLVCFHDIHCLFANNCTSDHIGDRAHVSIVLFDLLLDSNEVLFHVAVISELCILELLPHYGLEEPVVLLSMEI